MNNTKKLGIWMDHSNAHCLEFNNDVVEMKVLDSQFNHFEKEKSLQKSENIMHNKEQHKQAEYYKKLGEIILNYNEVLLFGPTDAKVELLNVLREDHHFDKIKIELMQADKMTDNQKHAFIKDYYSSN